MKIEVNGDLSKTEKRFVCQFCGCAFRANATEYNVDRPYGKANEIRGIDVKCPCCGVRIAYNPDEACNDDVIPKDQKKKDNR